MVIYTYISLKYEDQTNRNDEKKKHFVQMYLYTFIDCDAMCI